MAISQSSPKIKILFVITQGEMGGAQRYVFDLATHLDPNQYEILVACGAEKAELKEKLAAHHIPVKLLKNLVRNIHPLKDWLAILELKKLFLAYRPDLIHLNSGKAGFLGSLAAHFAGNKNVIFTAHGFTFLEPNSWLLRKIYLWAEKLARSWRKKIICVSEYDRLQALKHKAGTETQLVTIHNGIQIPTPPREEGPGEVIENSDNYDPLLISPSQGGEKNIIIGTIAHLYPTKGIKYLVEAAKIVTDEFPNAKFIIIGDGSEMANLESLIKKLGLEKSFSLKGGLPNAARLLREFDLFVLPSIKEGLPYTILEAMKAGIPIVATNVGGISEAISSLSTYSSSLAGEYCRRPDEGEGILVPPQKTQALAQAIIFLLENQKIAKALGRNAQERVKEFSLQTMLRKTEEVYDTMS